MKKRGIHKKLVIYFLSIVSVFSLLCVLFLVLHLYIVDRYEQISSNIFNQYKLIAATSDLTSSYNVYRNDPTSLNEELYLSKKQLLADIVSILDKDIVNQDSKITFLGVKNTILSVINETDSGIKGVKKSGTEDPTARFIEANRKFYFVKQNTANLILGEVQYSTVLRTQVAKLNTISIATGGVTIILILILTIISTNVWAKKLVYPLIKLSRLSEIITKGDIQSDVDSEILKLNDEVGMLAKSFDLMLKKLRGNIKELNASNDNLSKTQKNLEENNIYLVKVNKLMVDRELAMVKLKKKIQILSEANSISEEVAKRIAIIDSEGSIDGVNKG